MSDTPGDTVSDSDARVPASVSLDDWLDRLSGANGAPGGGAASGVMLAIGAALLRMVAAYTPDDAEAAACASRLVPLRQRALAAAEADGIRSAELGAALAIPADDADRDARLRAAAVSACASSRDLGEVGIDIVRELDLLDRVGNPNLRADLIVAAEALRAGLAGAITNLDGGVELLRAHGGADGDGHHHARVDAAMTDAATAVERMREALRAAAARGAG